MDSTKLNNISAWILLIQCFIFINTCRAQEYARSVSLYSSKAEMFSKNLHYDSAIIYYNKGISFCKDIGDWEQLVHCYDGLAQVHITLSQINEAMTNAKLAVEIINNKSAGKLPGLRGSVFVTMARICRLKGEYDQSLNFYNRALADLKLVFSELSPEIAQCYRGIALAYFYKSDFERSLEYYQHALRILKSSFSKNHNEIAAIYILKGFLYNSMGKYDSSEYLCKKAIQIFDKNHPQLSFANTYIGDSYRYRNDFLHAIPYYNISLSLIRDDVSQEKAVLHNNIGICYLQLKNYKLASTNFNVALKIGHKMFGDKHPGIASIYGSMGSSYEALGDLDQAIEYYQRSLVANFVSFNDLNPYVSPIDKEYLDREELLLNLGRKATALAKKYEINKDLKSLVASYNTYKLLDTLINEARGRTIDYKDKVQLGGQAALIYQSGIQVSRQLFQVTKDAYYHESLFLFSERNKAGALKEALSETAAKGIGLIPDNMLSLERDLKKRKSKIKSMIEQQKNDRINDKSKIENFNNEYFIISRKLDSLVVIMEKRYPGYYALKYQDKIADISKVQRSLDENTAMLEYFKGTDSIYAFVITPSTYKVISIPIDSLYSNRIASFTRSMKLFGEGESHPEEEYRRFVRDGYDLYNRFLKQPLDLIKSQGKIDHIIVIPDGQLSYLPFDILLMDKPKGKVGDYSSLQYVINRFTISYAYSASIYFLRKPNNLHRSNLKCISFAPHYIGGRPDSLNLLALGKFRDALSELKWNQREVESLSKNIAGDFFLANDATEEKFKKDAAHYGVIHLAMHALIDNEDPMNSKLVFYNNDDTENSEEDGYLHAFELYNMHLNAQMAVLSACNTGYGKLANGEGILSLARAFSYAGVESIIMSQWKVDDEATSEVMEYFYENLSEGMNKGAAMRAAKLNYLRNSDPAKNHPFFWGAFVAIGDDAPLTIGSNKKYANMMLIGFAIILSLFVFTKWFRRSKKFT